MLKDVNSNKYRLQHFIQAQTLYHKVFDLLIRFYTRIRDAVPDVEEMWVFLIESVWQTDLKGRIIFEQQHKQLFESEVMLSQFIKEFLTEIKTQYNAYSLRKKNRQASNLTDSLLENLYLNLSELEEDIAYEYTEEELQKAAGLATQSIDNP
jgi:hypothetical protein